MKKAFYLLLTVCFGISSALAQAPAKKKFEVYHGKPGITKKVSELQSAAAAARTAKEMPNLLRPNPVEFDLKEYKKFRESLRTKKSEKETLEKEETGEDAGSALAEPDNASTQQVWSNFLASTFEEFPFFAPPDPNGAVGPSQVAVVTNNILKVFEKKAVTEPPVVSYKGVLRTPAPSQFAIPLYYFFIPVLSEGSFPSDPHIRFDRLTKRWFLTAIELRPELRGNNILLAVSDGDRITDESSFIYYRISSGLLPYNPGSQAPLFDYPRMGIDKNAVLIGGSEFFLHSDTCGTYADSLYSVGYAIDKKGLLRGQLNGYVLKLGGIGAEATGMYVPQGVYNDNPEAPKSFFAGLSMNFDGLVLANLTYDANGFLTEFSQTTVPVEPFQFPRDVTALGSPMKIDAADPRLLEVSIYKNKLTGKSALWSAQHLGVNQSGGFVSGDDFLEQARTGSRWYQVENIYTKPSVAQSGTQYDGTQASGRRAISYFNPSIAANGQGHAVLGGTTSAYNRYLNAFVAGRYYSDAEGTLGTPQRVTATRAIYALNFGTYVDRWGDYSQTVVDPMDDQTMWSFQEYATSDDNFGVRAIQVKAPPPATPLPLNALSNKDNIWVTIKGVSVDNSGFFDPGSDKGGPGYNRLSVKATGGLLVSSLRFISPTEIRFRLNARNKPAGKYTLVITNPDGQFVTTDFEISAQTLKAVTRANTMLQEEVGKHIASSTVIPNPTPGAFQLQIAAVKDWMARVVVMDVTGKQLSVSRHNLGKGNNQIPLSVAYYDKGTYLAAVYNQYNVLIAIQKIVKQ